jgi:hypothetical protein
MACVASVTLCVAADRWLRAAADGVSPPRRQPEYARDAPIAATMASSLSDWIRTRIIQPMLLQWNRPR